MSEAREFFQTCGYIKDHLGHFYDVEELYQAFKARLIEELRVSSAAQDGFGWILRDESSWLEQEREMADKANIEKSS